MARLDLEKQKELEPKRMAFAVLTLEKAGFKPAIVNPAKIEFIFKNEKISFWPYSGWHSGKTIKDGRGLNSLLDQII